VHVVSERTQGLHSMAVHGTKALKTTLFLSGKKLIFDAPFFKENSTFFPIT
jgi:hypothetical protein